MQGTFWQALVDSLDHFYAGVGRFLPGLLAAVLIVLAGAVVAWLLKVAVRRALVVTRFDRFCECAGVTQVLGRADIRAAPSALTATLLFWLSFLSFLMAGLSALRVAVVNQLISGFFLYLPRILSAAAVLVVGLILAGFLARGALLAAVNAGVPSPRAISLVARFLITILAFAMALEQLEIAKTIVVAAFVIAFGAVMFGLALAFGLGGRDIAREILGRQLRDRDGPEGEDDLSHV